ncbi:MAG: alpha/beta hydrolase [Salaquimonas sp.]
MKKQDIISGTQRSWTVDGIKLAGQVFGQENGIPILALHGWLDNSASFEVLASAMPEARIVALDLPGHGHSDHRSKDGGYQIWDDLPQLIGVLDQLGWEKCVLLGHSRGGMIASLLAATMPERVSALVTMDAMLPYPVEDAILIKQLRSYLLDRNRISKKARRIFVSIEDFVARRARSGEPSQIARQIATRALKETDSGFEWRGDPLLSGASAVKMNKNQCVALLKALEMPVLNIWATPSERMAQLTEATRELTASHLSDLTNADIPGHHHWHMEQQTAEQIASAINGFLKAKL